MAIDKSKLTEDQKKRLEKLYHSYMKNIGIAFTLYTCWLFFANYSIAILNIVYLKDSELIPLLYTMNTAIYIFGLRGTALEKREEFEKDVNIIAGEQ